MKLVKQIGYKLIVTICIVMTLCSFIASTPVEASKVSTSDFYYSGTVKGSYTIDKGFFSMLIDSLGQIFDYIFGMATMGIRIVFVGWTAFMERCLTWILQGATGEKIDIDQVNSIDLVDTGEYITIDAIFFNRVPLLDINVFNFEKKEDVTATGMKIEDEVAGENTSHDAPMVVFSEEIIQGKKNDFLSATSNEDEDEESLVIILKKAIAGWYYSFRLISIMIMLVLLIYIGVKLAIESSATEKALYKSILVDWFVGMILVFSIHYIMLFIIQFNEVLVTQIAQLREGATGLEVYEYGLIERAQEPVENDELEMTLYEEVKTRAYDPKFTVGMTGMIMYMVLVYYAWKYTFIYLKRYLTVAVLVMMAPLVALSYAFNKVTTGKSKVFTGWLKEFFFIVILQSIHALIYLVFMDTILALSLSSIAAVIIVFMLLNFISKAEGIFRKIFGISGALTKGVTDGSFRDALKDLRSGMAVMGAGKVAKTFTKTTNRILSKPLRMAGNFGFGKIMEHRAGSDRYKKKNDNFMKEKAERAEKVRRGSIAKAIKNKSIDVQQLEEAVESLKNKKGEKIKDQFGNEVEVTDEYIASEEAALADIKEIDQNKDNLAAQYDKMTSQSAMLAHFVKGKWREVLNPYQYVEKQKDGKYKAIKTRREYGKYGKKKDGVGMRFKEQVKFKKLLNIDKNSQTALTQQLELTKNRILGFSGILIGLPLLIAEPKVGVALLYTGIGNTAKLYSDKGEKKKKKLIKDKKTSEGKLTLQGFEGASKQTIANESKRQAREQMEEIFIDKARNDANMVSRVRHKHPKVYAALKGTLNIATSTVITAAVMPIAPVTIPVITGLSVAAGSLSATAVYHARGRASSNKWTALHETMKAAKKLDEAAYKSELNGTEGYLNFLADKYYEMEVNQNAEEIKDHAKEFAKLYIAVQANNNTEVDQMTNEEVRRDSGYEEIEVKIQENGKPKLSVSSEMTIIDNAIIDVAQEVGIDDINNLEMSADYIQRISKKAAMKLKQLGLLGEKVNPNEVIENLEERIKDRQAALAKEGIKPVEERMTDQAIIEVMQINGITDPSKVKDEDVYQRLSELKETILINKPTTDTAKALKNMQILKQNVEKTNISQVQTTSEDIIEQARLNTVIAARKSIITAKSKSITDEKTDRMRDALKRKKNAELTEQIVRNDKEKSSEIIGEMLTNAGGGITETDTYAVTPPKKDDIIKLLQTQTEIYQSKTQMQSAINSMTSEKRKQNYKQLLFDIDGSIKIDAIRDGSLKF